jgi:hypothetical protein
MKKKGQEPAFPVIHQNNDGTLDLNLYPGMSTRLYLAGMILSGIMSSDSTVSIENGLGANEIGCALMIADELLRQEEVSRDEK